MPLFSLAYLSTATRRMSDDDLLDILRAARRFNTAQGITGMLTYFGDTFVQVLEGEQETVLALMQHIQQDTRHRSVTVTRTREITERAFTEWAMAFVNGDRFQDEAGVHPGLAPSFSADAILAHADRADALMDTLRPGLGASSSIGASPSA